MRDAFKVYGVTALLVVLGFVVAFKFVDPAPPGQLTIATGSAEGAYHAFGQRFRDILARDGIAVTLVETEGSVANLGLLAAVGESRPDQAVVDIAFVQSGVGGTSDFPGLVALASLYYEPLWVFTRGEVPVSRLVELAGGRLAIGAEGSGTRHVALQLLAASGLGDGDGQGTEIEDLGGSEAIAALLEGQVDAAFLVTGKESPVLKSLLRRPDIQLFSFDRAQAYERRFPSISSVLLPQGVVDLGANLPARDVTLLSPLATLVAREDVHPALIDLVMMAAAEIHGGPGLFQNPGQFPSPLNVDFPLSPEAERYFESGLSFLKRVLPFWAASLIERAWVLILPVLTLLIPLIRIAPPTYRWQVRRRIYRWYRDLRSVEAVLHEAARTDDDEKQAEGLAKLDRLQDEVEQVVVPLSYADDLYHLRVHADFVRHRATASLATIDQVKAD